MTSPGWLKATLRPSVFVSRLSSSSLSLSDDNHSCSACRITVSPPPQGGRFSLPVSISKRHIERALQLGCPFTQWCVSEAAEVGQMPPLEFVVEFTLKGNEQYDLVEAEFKFHARFGPSLTVCANADDPAAKYISTRPINPEPSSDASCGLAMQWIEDCLAHHPQCATPLDDFVPMRLIHVGSDDGAQPRLHATRRGEKLQWCCLSYCWGGDQLVKTTKATREPFSRSIPWSLIPPTLQDAIKTTRMLGISYLWVDTFCITQDDSAEMADQVAVMSRIYKKAYVTIVASIVGNSSTGFLQRRELAESDRPLFSLSYRCPNGDTGKIRFFVDNGYDPREEPVRRRAWTMQERLLSVRILDFGTRHLRWSCRTVTKGDGGHRNPIPSGAEAAERLRPEIYDKAAREKTLKSPRARYETLQSWSLLVQDYTARHLTISEDKFAAIAGLAQEYSDACEVTFFAGFIEELLPETLLWAVKPGAQRLRPSNYRAPSFSWAAVDSPVFLSDGLTTGRAVGTSTVFDFDKVTGRHYAIVLEKIVHDRYLDEKLHDVPHYSLKLNAPVVADEWVGREDALGKAQLRKLGRDANVDAIDEVCIKLIQCQTIPVFIIGIMDVGGSWYSLVAASDDNQTFRRLGTCYVSLGTKMDWQWRDLTLI